MFDPQANVPDVVNPLLHRDRWVWSVLWATVLCAAACVVIGLTLGWGWLGQAVAASFYGLGHAIPVWGPRWFPAARAPAWPATPPPRPLRAPAPGAPWPWARWAVAAAALFAAAATPFVVARVRARRFRAATQQWVELELFQNDVADPDQVRALYNALWNALYPRSPVLGSPFFVRWWTGADAVTLMVLRDPAADGGEWIHLLLGAPARSLDRVCQAVQNVYQNVRFHPWPHPIPARWPHLLRWSVSPSGPLHLLTLTSNYDAQPMEALIQAMARPAWSGAPPDAFCVAWTLRPVARTRAEAAVARAARLAQWEGGAAPQGARAALSQLGHGLFRVDWRAGAATYDAAQRLVGALGLHNSQASLVPHNVVVWRSVIGRWLAWGLPTHWPLALGPRLWSGELATFAALPSGRLRVAELRRANVRRMPASRALCRDPALALVEAEGGDRVGLYLEDLVKNLLLLGIQGSGKSTHLLNLFANLAALRDTEGRPAAPVILFDIGKDTAQAALQLAPPDRTVLYVAPGDDLNPWGLPLLSGASTSLAQVNHVIEVLGDVFGADALGPRSRQILQHLLATVLAAATPDQPPSLDQAYQAMVDEGYRQALVARAKLGGRLDEHTEAFWTLEYPQAVATNPQFWEEALAAPRNKLHEFLRSRQLRLVLGAADAQGYLKRAVDWDRVIRERQIVILDLSLEHLGAATVRLFGIVATLNLWLALERQGRLPEAERVPVYTLYDEAQQYLSPSFLRILALGRAYGWRTALATRFLDELDPAVRDGVEDLCQNRIIHRIPLEPEAKRLMLNMMTVYINNITLQEEAQALERFMADDIMRLNDRQAICYWQAHGALQPPFVAVTLDWRFRAHATWAAHHRAQQPRAEARALDPLPAPPMSPAPASPSSDAPGASAAAWPVPPSVPAPSSVAPVPAAPSLSVPAPSPAAPASAATPLRPAAPPAPDAPPSADPPPAAWTWETLAQRHHLYPRQLRDLCELHGVTLADAAALLTAAAAAGTLPTRRSEFGVWFTRQLRQEVPHAR